MDNLLQSIQDVRDSWNVPSSRYNSVAERGAFTPDVNSSSAERNAFSTARSGAIRNFAPANSSNSGAGRSPGPPGRIGNNGSTRSIRDEVPQL